MGDGRDRNGQPRRGFSLIELLVVVALAGILLGFALPSLGWLERESRASALTDEFVGALQTARSEAIKRSGPVVLCASDAPLAAEPACAATSYADGWIVYVDGTGGTGRDAPDDVLILQQGPAGTGTSYAPSANVASRVRFDGTGAHVLDNGAPFRGDVELEVGGETRTVVIAASGRVSSPRP